MQAPYSQSTERRMAMKPEEEEILAEYEAAASTNIRGRPQYV